jgi:hypothetical protein
MTPQEIGTMLTILKKLSQLCPSNEGLGGHAPLAAFYQIAWEARHFINMRNSQLTTEQQLLESYLDQSQVSK